MWFKYTIKRIYFYRIWNFLLSPYTMFKNLDKLGDNLMYIITGAACGILYWNSLFLIHRLANNVIGLSTVSGKSMQPTLNPNKDQDVLLVDKFTPLHLYKYRKGQVVILKSPVDPKKYYVKRIVALPQEEIINRVTGEKIIVPKGHCWVEGDNFSTSYDSNYFGAVPLALIQGNAMCIVWPPKRIGILRKECPDRYQCFIENIPIDIEEFPSESEI